MNGIQRRNSGLRVLLSRVIALCVAFTIFSMPLAAWNLPEDLQQEEASTRKVVEERKALYVKAMDTAEEESLLPLGSRELILVKENSNGLDVVAQHVEALEGGLYSQNNGEAGKPVMVEYLPRVNDPERLGDEYKLNLRPMPEEPVYLENSKIIKYPNKTLGWVITSISLVVPTLLISLIDTETLESIALDETMRIVMPITIGLTGTFFGMLTAYNSNPREVKLEENIEKNKNLIKTYEHNREEVKNHNQRILESANLKRDRLEIVDLETGKKRIIWEASSDRAW